MHGRSTGATVHHYADAGAQINPGATSFLS